MVGSTGGCMFKAGSYLCTAFLVCYNLKCSLSMLEAFAW